MIKDKVKILLIDDHKLFLDGLSQLIKGFSNYIVYSANSGEEALTILEDENIDLVTIDIHMPELDGFDLLKIFDKTYPNLKKIMLSMDDTDDSKVKAFKLGCNAYLNKTVESSIIQNVIVSVLENGFYADDSILKLIIGGRSKSEDKIKKIDSLSLRETEMIKLMCTELTYQEIADKVFLSPRTVMAHKQNIFRKLNVKSRVGVVLWAMKNKIISE